MDRSDRSDPFLGYEAETLLLVLTNLIDPF